MYIITYQTAIIKSFYQNVIAKMVKLKILFSKLVFYAIIKKTCFNPQGILSMTSLTYNVIFSILYFEESIKRIDFMSVGDTNSFRSHCRFTMSAA